MIRNSLAIVMFAATLITSGCVGTTGKGAVGGGNGTGTAAISVSPASINFGSIVVGSGWMQPVTVTNDGTKSVTISKISVTGSGFTVGGMAAPTTLSAGQTGQVLVAFKATAAGASAGAVTIASTAEDATTTIPLNGQGFTSGVELSTDAVNFGSVALGATATQTVKITNSGSGSATISKASVTGSGVTMSGLTVPSTLAAGASASATLTFKPTTSATESGTLTVTTSASSTALTANWTGSGSSSSLTMTPSSVSFGSVTVGSNATQTIKLANSGSSTITISSLAVSGTGMSISGIATPYSLGAGKSATLTAEFKPTSAATDSGSITIDSNATSSSASIPLSGKGVSSTVALSASTTSLSFGSVKSGSASTQSVTVTSTGNANANISGVTVSGTGFSLSGSGAAETLTPGQAVQFTVNFDPKAAGNDTGTLSIASNAPNSPLKVSLSGTGTSTSSPSTSHTVALSWDQSSSSVVGYYVYRGTKASGPYTKLNTSPSTSTYYSDSTVNDGAVYYYVVTAVNSSNIESADSNQVSATIPSN